MNRNDFIINEKASRDTIDVKRTYIMMAGDHAAGVLLSQIVYWHLPDKEGNPTKMQVEKNGELWIAKKRDEWWDEICMLPKQFDRAIRELENRELVKTELFRFGGSPVKHIRLNWDTFLKVYNAIINGDIPFYDSKSPKGGKWIFPDRVNPITRSGNMETPDQGISETLRKPTPAIAPMLAGNGHRLHTETTTKNTINHHLINPGDQSGKDDDFEKDEKDKQTIPVRESFLNPGVLEKKVSCCFDESFPIEIPLAPFTKGGIKVRVKTTKKGNLPLDEYMNAVEAKVSALQIRQVLSSLESPKVAEMYKAGVPLDLIIRTIDSVTRNSKCKIKSFNYFVESIWEAFDATSQKQTDRSVEYKATQNLIERLR